MRGIKLELLAIRNSLVKANQRRHEFGQRAEEAKQKPLNGAHAGGAAEVTRLIRGPLAGIIIARQ